MVRLGAGVGSWALRSRAPDEIQCVGRNGVVRVRVSALVLEAGVMCGLGDAAMEGRQGCGGSSGRWGPGWPLSRV